MRQSTNYIYLTSLNPLDKLGFFMLPDSNIQEGLSCSYVKAVANMSGYSIEFIKADFGIDALVGEIRVRQDGRTYNNGTFLSIQIKSTYRFRENQTHIMYDLKNKNYNDLIDTSGITPKILVVLCMPEEKEEWLKHNIEALILKKCAYWTYLGSLPPVADNDSTTVVHIRKDRCFSPENLKVIMNKVQRKEDLNGI